MRGVTSTLEGVNTGKEEEWKKVKLKEVIKNPEFIGKTVRLGERVFEVKGVLSE
ncbi:MAG: hypothetical protein IBX41_02095 [Methanophagales archaeon]|nr:hypothetical protein [Methanophagales archaeon]